jgi:hypothetical protein
MRHRTITGTILYTSKKPELLDQKRGIEHFRFTRHHDGKVTLRAYCEIEEPSPTVMRDIVYSLDEHGRPMDCLLRLTIGDEFMGSGWFRFTDSFVECESYGPAIGRLSQKIAIDTPLEFFGTHPVVADGYLLSNLQLAPGEQRKIHLMLPSPDHRGATPPLLAKASIDVRFVGHVEKTVKAGTFKARHYQFIDDGTAGLAGQHPAYDVWITDDEDGVMICGGVGGYMMTWYELISLER